MEKAEAKDRKPDDELETDEEVRSGFSLTSYTDDSEDEALAEEASAPTLQARIERLEKAYDDLLAQQSQQSSSKMGIMHPPADLERRELPQVSSLKPTRALSDVPKQSEATTSPNRWLLFELVAEVRSIFRMYIDFRYQLTWFTKVAVPVIIGVMLLNWWIIGSIPLIGWLLSRVFDITLIYVLVKILSREATRYRRTSLDLPSSLRL